MPGPKFSLDWSTFFFFWKFGFSLSTNNYFTQISRKFWTENIFGRMATAQKFPPYFPSYHLQRQFIARNVLCIGIDEAKLKRNIGVHQTKSWITIQTHLEKVCRQTKLKFPWNNGVGEIKNWKEKNSNASNFEDTREVSSFWTSKTLNLEVFHVCFFERNVSCLKKFFEFKCCRLNCDRSSSTKCEPLENVDVHQNTRTKIQRKWKFTVQDFRNFSPWPSQTLSLWRYCLWSFVEVWRQLTEVKELILTFQNFVSYVNYLRDGCQKLWCSVLLSFGF